MKKTLIVAAFCSTVLMSCENGITYSACQVTSTDPIANIIYPDGVCLDIEGGGFLLSADAENYCKDDILNGSDSFLGITRDELIAEPQRASCPTDEE